MHGRSLVCSSWLVSQGACSIVCTHVAVVVLVLGFRPPSRLSFYLIPCSGSSGVSARITVVCSLAGEVYQNGDDLSQGVDAGDERVTAVVSFNCFLVMLLLAVVVTVVKTMALTVAAVADVVVSLARTLLG